MALPCVGACCGSALRGSLPAVAVTLPCVGTLLLWLCLVREPACCGSALHGSLPADAVALCTVLLSGHHGSWLSTAYCESA